MPRAKSTRDSYATPDHQEKTLEDHIRKIKYTLNSVNDAPTRKNQGVGKTRTSRTQGE